MLIGFVSDVVSFFRSNARQTRSPPRQCGGSSGGGGCQNSSSQSSTTSSKCCGDDDETTKATFGNGMMAEAPRPASMRRGGGG